VTHSAYTPKDAKPDLHEGYLASPKKDTGNLLGKHVEKSLLRGLSFCGVAMDGNSVVVDVRNDKIIRIKPLHYDWKYDPHQFNSWKIKARGKTFEPSMKTLIPEPRV
jgi:hypothetical protein